MKSLMIASLPKSLSTVTYKICLDATRLIADSRVPRHGEVFNTLEDCRKVLYGQRNVFGIVEHMRLWKDGYVVKDVLAPEAMLFLRPNFNILHCIRPVADVAYLRLMRSHFAWELMILPPELAPKFDGLDYEMIEGANREFVEYHMKELVDGIIWGQLMLKEAAHTTLPYDALIRDQNVLYDALENFGYRVDRKNYLNPRFKHQAQKKLEIRGTQEWAGIQTLVKERYPVVKKVWNENLLRS